VTLLEPSSVQMTLQAWTKSEDYWQAKADVLQAAKEALDAAWIEIPFPHQVAVPYGEDGSSEAPPAPRKSRKTGPGKSSDPSPGDAHQDSGGEG
jgi:small conductance mechanosensitive channel